MRRASIAAAAALLALGGAGAVCAQQQGPQHGGMTMGMDPDGGGTMTMMMDRSGMTGQCATPMMGVGRHIEGRLAFLRTELKITPAQEPLWSAVAEAMRANAQRLAGTMPCCSEAQNDGTMHRGGTTAQGAAPSLPDRLDRQERLLAARLDALRSMKDAITPLYATFSVEQREAADHLVAGPTGMGMMM